MPIILTRLRHRSGRTFQTAQELIEALDAFAVRAKLTGNNTAMGPSSPAVRHQEGAGSTPRCTAPTNAGHSRRAREDDDNDNDNDETQVFPRGSP